MSSLLERDFPGLGNGRKPVDFAIILIVVFGTLSTLAFSLRMYVRARLLRLFMWTDYLMVLSFVLYLVFSVVSIVFSVVALSIINGDLSEMNLVHRLEKGWLTSYGLTVSALKASVGMFFLQLFGSNRMPRIIIIGMMAASVLTGMLYSGMVAFTCSWLTSLPVLGYCKWQRTTDVILYVFSVVQIVGDLVITVIAVVQLVRARLPLITKLSATFLLACTCLGATAGIIRLYLLREPISIVGYPMQIFKTSHWLVAELFLYLTSANLVMIRPLFTAMLVRLGVLRASQDEDAVIAICAPRGFHTPRHNASKIALGSQNHFKNEAEVDAIFMRLEMGGLEKNQEPQQHDGPDDEQLSGEDEPQHTDSVFPQVDSSPAHKMESPPPPSD